MLATKTRPITRRSLQAALEDQGFEEAFDLKTIDALLDPNLQPDSEQITHALKSGMVPSFHALLPTVSDADFTPAFIEYSKDVLDDFFYAIRDADTRIRADRLMPDARHHLRNLVDIVLAVLYDKLTHGEAYIMRIGTDDIKPEVFVSEISKLFGMPISKDPRDVSRQLVLNTATEFFGNVPGIELADPYYVPATNFHQMTRLEWRILVLGIRKKLEQSFDSTIDTTEGELLKAYQKLKHAARIAYSTDGILIMKKKLLEFHENLVYLGLMEYFGNRHNITEKQKEEELERNVLRRWEGTTIYKHDHTLSLEAGLYLARKFKLKNPFAHGGKIYYKRNYIGDKVLAVVHIYSGSSDINLRDALKNGQEHLIIMYGFQRSNSSNSELDLVTHAAAKGGLQQFLNEYTFDAKLVPTGILGYAANPYGVAQFLEDRKLFGN